MPRENRTPSYRLHRPSGQAVTTIDGKDFYLGPWQSKASRLEYDRLIAEWLAAGRRLPSSEGSTLTIAELIAAFWTHAQKHYVSPEGEPTSEQSNFRLALRPLNRLYGRTVVDDFGPLALKAVRLSMVEQGAGPDPRAKKPKPTRGWCRLNVNQQISRLKHVFKWGVENELVPPHVYQGVAAVAGLRLGRSDARESEPVKPVPEHVLEATLPHLSRHVRGMVDLQLVTGMRPGEICSMRISDIDTRSGGKLWVYQPLKHKTFHHGHKRTVYLGPRAQQILGPFLKPDLQAFVFSPAEAESERREQFHARRKTPLSCGNRPGSNRVRSPKRAPRDRYDVASYRRAIARACDKATAEARKSATPGEPEPAPVPHWHPHQLRHNAATRLRKDYGLEAAQVILGHKTLTVTQIYAEKNVAAAQKIMVEVG